MKHFKYILALFALFTGVQSALARPQRIRLQAPVGQYVRDQNINLFAVFPGLVSFQGQKISSVEVMMQPPGNGSRAMLTLLGNGRIVATDFFPRNWSILSPNQTLLTNNLRSLSVFVRDKVYIQSIAINLDPYPVVPPNPQEIILPVVVNQNFLGQGSVDLTPYVQNYPSNQITAIDIEGQTFNGAGSRSVRVMINGTIEGAVYKNSANTIDSVFPQNVFITGQNLHALVLLVDPSVTLRTVQIHLVHF